jgi:hypothetical protein
MTHNLCSYKGCPDFGRYCRRYHPGIVEKDEVQESLAVLTKKAVAAFNLYIRLRDKDKGCISCSGKVEDAGHYLAAGSFSGVRFNEVNVNGQCHHNCNTGKYGNPEAYREGLVKRRGEKAVKGLEAHARETKKFKWTRSLLLETIEKYQSKVKDMKPKSKRAA